LAKRTELGIVFSPEEEMTKATVLRLDSLCQAAKEFYTPKNNLYTILLFGFLAGRSPIIRKNLMLNCQE